MQIDFRIEENLTLGEETLRKICIEILTSESQNDAELSVVLTNDREIQQLNCDYRGKDKPTDVLSFAMQEGEETPGNILGDIVISLDAVKRQSVEYEVGFGEELLRLLIHGTLHLLGYDHENVSEEEVQRMEKKEEQLFTELRPLVI